MKFLIVLEIPLHSYLKYVFIAAFRNIDFRLGARPMSTFSAVEMLEQRLEGIQSESPTGLSFRSVLIFGRWLSLPILINYSADERIDR